MLKAKEQAVNACQLQNKFSRATYLDQVLLLVEPSLVPESAEKKQTVRTISVPAVPGRSQCRVMTWHLRATNSLLSPQVLVTYERRTLTAHGAFSCWKPEIRC
jgi:hypothetical protein